jgi:hypothetical protein
MIFILIGIVFTIIFYMVYTKFLEYRDERYNWVRPPLPLWAFLSVAIIELIPILNLVVAGLILFGLFGMINIEKNVRLKSHSKSKILDFFNYDLNANSRKNN